MKKTKSSKLKLNLKSVQKLRQADLKAVVGGAMPMTGGGCTPRGGY